MPGFRWIEYPTADGVKIVIQVPDDVALALVELDAPREGAVMGTRLANLDWLDEAATRRRVAQRRDPTGNPWEGPRFRFSLLLGEGRPNWTGGETIDDAGRCGICHDAWLPPYAACLACCRTGRDDAIPTPGERMRKRAPRQSRSRSGKRLAGGVGR